MANRANNGLIFRDGQSRRTRALPALDPAFFSVEEHTPADLIRFAQEYAKELKFFELDGSVSGDWSGFLTPPEGLNLTPEDMLAFYHAPDDFAGTAEQRAWLSRPHFTLFMAFLDLLKEPKAQLDDLTRSHLDFYFRDVLRFQPRPFEPDRVHVLFEPARGVAVHPVPKGTLLHAGKDAAGKALHYATVDDLLVTQARVADIRRVFKDAETEKTYANSSWREGMKIPEGFKYQALGSDLKGHDEMLAEIGFAVCSPLLDLSSGMRLIGLQIDFANDYNPSQGLESIIQKSFKIRLTTGAEDWEVKESFFPLVSNENLKLLIFIPPDAPPILEPIQNGNSEFPILKILIDQNKAGSGGFNEISNIRFTNAILQVWVIEFEKGLSDLVLKNDDGIINSKNSFHPFSIWPKVGSTLTFSHKELCIKPINSIGIKFNWKGVPEDFKKHYQAYIDTGYMPLDFAFRMAISVSGQINHNNNNLIFTHPIGFGFPGSLPGVVFKNPIYLADPFDFPRYFQIVLESPDFQHSNFPLVINKYKDSGSTADLNPPYTPEIQSIEIGYESSQVYLSLSSSEDEHQFLYIHPFGYAAPCLSKDASGRTPNPRLLPQPEAAGNLFIGLTGTEDTREISLLLQILPGMTKADQTAPPVMQWQYLDRDCWIPLDEKHVLIDRTRSLLNAGLLRLKLPEVASLAHTAMPAGLYWLKASATENASAAGDLIAAHAQAAEAVWQDNGNAALHLVKPLPADSIKEPVRRDPNLRALSQPYTSFGGRMPEADAALYTRAAERLRHKQRALAAWDYERLVLDRFPELYKVKCLHNWEKPYLGNAYQDRADGKVVLVVIPDLANRAPFFPLQPRVSNELKAQVAEYIRTLTSPFAEVEVRNPRFEFIRYRMDIRFHRGYDEAYYRQELNRALQRFLSPWAYEAGADIGFGSRIYHAEVIHFIEKLPYVDYVVNFKLARQFEEVEDEYGCIADNGFAGARYPDSILVSHLEHIIGTVLRDDFKPEEFIGVGYDRIEIDLRVYQSS
jgi:hypothetical protein